MDCPIYDTASKEAPKSSPMSNSLPIYDTASKCQPLGQATDVYTSPNQSPHPKDGDSILQCGSDEEVDSQNSNRDDDTSVPVEVSDSSPARQREPSILSPNELKLATLFASKTNQASYPLLPDVDLSEFDTFHQTLLGAPNT